MADDIVLKIAVEGEDEATSALEKIGQGATASFEDTQKAAETAGLSIEDFGRLSEKTQQAYMDLSKRVQEGSQQIVASTAEVAQAAQGGAGTGQIGAGLDQVSTKSGITGREMKALGKIMGALGAGEAAHLAVTFQRVGSSLGGLGVAALAFALTAGSIVKVVKEATESAKGMDELAQATGASAEALSTLEAGFASAGVASKAFAAGTKALFEKMTEEAPKIGAEIAESMKRALEAQVAYGKAVIEAHVSIPQKLALEAQQLALQGRQYAEQLSSLREQLATLDAIQGIESKRADLAVLDAEANLKMLKLKRDLLNNRITQDQYDRAAKQNEKESLARQIQKAELEVESARNAKAALEAKQQAERTALELQKVQVQQSIEQNKVAQQTNALMRQQIGALQKIATLNEEIEKQKGLETKANEIGGVTEKYLNLAQGIKQSFDPLTTADTKVRAFIEALRLLGKDVATAYPEIAKMFDGLSKFDKIKFEEMLKKIGMPEEEIAKLRKGSAEFEKLMAAGARLEPFNAALNRFGDTMGLTGQKASNFGTIIGGSTVMALEKFGQGVASLLGLFADTQIGEKFAQLGQTIRQTIANIFARAAGAAGGGSPLQWVVDAFQGVVQGIGERVAAVQKFVADWVTTPVGNAWGWITEAWTSVGTAIEQGINTAKEAITSFVTTPVANAFQWVKDMFNSVLDAIKQKIDVVKGWFGGGASSTDSGGGGDGMARGGLLGGRGSGTSDSNLIWASRGEHIMPAGAVAQPGVLQFLEALRRSGGNLRAVLGGMGRFAVGGLVLSMPKMPAALGGAGMHNVTINFPGLPEITGLRASSAVVEELQHAASLAQVRSGGRKPSRYR